MAIRAAPFAELRNYVVGIKVIQGVRPPRPTEQDCGGVALSDALWKLTEDCWRATATERPLMKTVVERLRPAAEEAVLND
jgi:hypothetical protein